MIVDRGEHIPNEHKFYAGLSIEEVQEVLAQLKPVLIKNEKISDIPTLLKMIEQFKDKQ